MGSPERQRVLIAPGAAEPARELEHKGRLIVQLLGQGGEQDRGLRIVAAECEPGLGLGTHGGVEPHRLPRRRLGIAPGEPVEARPLILRQDDRAVTPEERGFRGRVDDPGAPRFADCRRGGVRLARGGEGLGAAEQRLRQMDGCARALVERGRLVGFARQRLFPAAFQQRLIRPILIRRHERGDLGGAGRIRREQPVVRDELARDGIRILGRRRRGIGPAIGAHGAHRVLCLRRRREDGEQRQSSAESESHAMIVVQPCLAAHPLRA